MQNVPDVSSEEELLKLREEGKISEQQHEELLGAIRKPPKKDSSVELPAEPQFEAFRKRILIGSLIMCILGVLFGLILDLPLVWGLAIFGMIAIPIKFHLVNKRQQHKRNS
ncbi:MAG: hypothetical protein PVJ86_01735 [Phycisphaerales bacterium]|jgi:hypothetical protein